MQEMRKCVISMTVLIYCCLFQVSDEKESLQFMILVHVDEDINAPPATKNGDSSTGRAQRRRPSGISSGWVVMRSLNQVHVRFHI